MRAAKVDGNQPAIVGALRRAGATVETLHRVGGGCPDLLVGYQGRNYLIEVKLPTGKLNEIQGSWHQHWRGQVVTAKSISEALTAIGALA